MANYSVGVSEGKILYSVYWKISLITWFIILQKCLPEKDREDWHGNLWEKKYLTLFQLIAGKVDFWIGPKHSVNAQQWLRVEP